MPITEAKLKKIQDVLKIMNNTLSEEDIMKFFKNVVALVNEIKRLNTKEFSQFNTKIEGMLNKVSKLKDGKDGKDGIGIKGDKGDIGLQGKIIKGINGADGSPDTAEMIRNKLEFLEGEERFDISSIKGLRRILTRLEERPMGGKAGFGFAYSAMDRHMFDDQTFTGTQNGTNKIFTIIKAPDPLSSLKVYRGGARQRITEDYTVSGQTVTFTVAPATEEVLLYDLRA